MYVTQNWIKWEEICPQHTRFELPVTSSVVRWSSTSEPSGSFLIVPPDNNKRKLLFYIARLPLTSTREIVSLILIYLWKYWTTAVCDKYKHLLSVFPVPFYKLQICILTKPYLQNNNILYLKCLFIAGRNEDVLDVCDGVDVTGTPRYDHDSLELENSTTTKKCNNQKSDNCCT